MFAMDKNHRGSYLVHPLVPLGHQPAPYRCFFRLLQASSGILAAGGGNNGKSNCHLGAIGGRYRVISHANDPIRTIWNDMSITMGVCTLFCAILSVMLYSRWVWGGWNSKGDSKEKQNQMLNFFRSVSLHLQQLTRTYDNIVQFRPVVPLLVEF